jgi:transposase, IS5 family
VDRWSKLLPCTTQYVGLAGNPFSLLTMLRIHLIQQWFMLSDPGMEEAFLDAQLYRDFALPGEFACLPDESTFK